MISIRAQCYNPTLLHLMQLKGYTGARRPPGGGGGGGGTRNEGAHAALHSLDLPKTGGLLYGQALKKARRIQVQVLHRCNTPSVLSGTSMLQSIYKYVHKFSWYILSLLEWTTGQFCQRSGFPSINYTPINP